MYTKNLMNQILSHKNVEWSIKQVRKNKGNPSVDGMTFDEIKGYFVEHEAELRKQIRLR